MDCSVPQGSVLGRLEFFSFTELFTRHTVTFHWFTDDKQLLHSGKVSETIAILSRFKTCLADTSDWCAYRKLQLNAMKTEIAWFGSCPKLNKISGSDCSLSVGCDVIKPKEVVHDLTVYLDSELTLKQHISKVANTSFYHLRRLRQIRRSTGNDVMIQLVVAFHYCNAVLAGLPCHYT